MISSMWTPHTLHCLVRYGEGRRRERERVEREREGGRERKREKARDFFAVFF